MEIVDYNQKHYLITNRYRIFIIQMKYFVQQSFFKLNFFTLITQKIIPYNTLELRNFVT